MIKYLYFAWVIVVHSLYFIGIELKEGGIKYFIILILVNIVLSLFILYRTNLPEIECNSEKDKGGIGAA